MGSDRWQPGRWRSTPGTLASAGPCVSRARDGERTLGPICHRGGHQQHQEVAPNKARAFHFQSVGPMERERLVAARQGFSPCRERPRRDQLASSEGQDWPPTNSGRAGVPSPRLDTLPTAPKERRAGSWETLGLPSASLPVRAIWSPRSLRRGGDLCARAVRRALKLSSTRSFYVAAETLWSSKFW